jgi:hypothetical protein
VAETHTLPSTTGFLSRLGARACGQGPCGATGPSCPRVRCRSDAWRFGVTRMPRIASSAALESRGKLLLALGSWREAWPCPWTDHCIEPGQRSPRMCSTIERAPCLFPSPQRAAAPRRQCARPRRARSPGADHRQTGDRVTAALAGPADAGNQHLTRPPLPQQL